MSAAIVRTCGRMLPAVACAGLILVTVPLAGCDSLGGGGKAQGATAAPVQHPLLENIPLPHGFRIVPERSVARMAGPLRVAQCEFQGSTSPDAVARFYVEYLPTARFTLLNKRFDNGQYSMRFESASEECNIRIRPQNAKTVLVIDIGPLAKATNEEDLNPARQP